LTETSESPKPIPGSATGLIYELYLSGTTKMNTYEEAYEIAKLQAIITACSTIPGYWFTVYFINRVGRVKIQMIGFLLMAIVYLAIGIHYSMKWKGSTNVGFMILYGLTFFFSNFGPNTTTFIVPAELFPARFRSNSGAAGKVGAIIGSVGFFWASHSEKKNGYPKAIRMTASLVILAMVCTMGFLIL
jgi:PHS family inorganic phosphate transporter-like MFS transporter